MIINPNNKNCFKKFGLNVALKSHRYLSKLSIFFPMLGWIFNKKVFCFKKIFLKSVFGKNMKDSFSKKYIFQK